MWDAEPCCVLHAAAIAVCCYTVIISFSGCADLFEQYCICKSVSAEVGYCFQMGLAIPIFRMQQINSMHTINFALQGSAGAKKDSGYLGGTQAILVSVREEF